MRLILDEQSIFNVASLPQAAFTANATTDVLTSSAHGLQNGDLLQLTTSGTLPAGLALVTNYYVINKTTNTFQLAATKGGSAINITDTGTGTHTYHLKGRIIDVADFEHIILALGSASSGSFTVKLQGSTSKTAPDFASAQSASNLWDYIQAVDLNDGYQIDGDEGITLNGTDDFKLIELNTNGLRWISANFTSWTAGKLGLKASLYNNN